MVKAKMLPIILIVEICFIVFIPVPTFRDDLAPR